MRSQPTQLECWLTSDLSNGQSLTNWNNHGNKSASIQINANNNRAPMGPGSTRQTLGKVAKTYWRVVLWGGGYYDLELRGPAQFMRRFRGYLNLRGPSTANLSPTSSC